MLILVFIGTLFWPIKSIIYCDLKLSTPEQPKVGRLKKSVVSKMKISISPFGKKVGDYQKASSPRGRWGYLLLFPQPLSKIPYFMRETVIFFRSRNEELPDTQQQESKFGFLSLHSEDATA